MRRLRSLRSFDPSMVGHYDNFVRHLRMGLNLKFPSHRSIMRADLDASKTSNSSSMEIAMAPTHMRPCCSTSRPQSPRVGHQARDQAVDHQSNFTCRNMGTVPRQLRPTGHFAIRSSSSSSPSPAPSSAAMRAWMATPSVAVDEARLKANIDRMQQLASSHGVQLRPHAKTHKTREVASLQVAAGACGVAVSKPSEALKFLHAGIDRLKSVLLAFPVVQPTKLSKVVHASQQTGIELLVTVDSALGVDALEKAALSCDHQVKALLHIDVGYHRVGLEEDDPRILELAKRVHASKALQFGGLLSHAGHAYSCKSVEECAEVAEIERCIMVRIKKSLEENGVPVPIVSCGSTLTEPARQSFEGITEIRPGNYVFLDRTPVRMGLVTVKDVALSVVVTVVSSNKRYFIVDGGSKVFSSDGVRSGGDVGANTYGLAFYERDFDRVVGEPTVSGRGAPADDGTEVPCFPLVKLSEEHGWVKHVEGVESPPLGARLVVLPNHACVVANLTDTLYVQGQQPKSWKLISRGCTQ